MNQERFSRVNSHAKADFIIEGIRGSLGFSFESLELLPGWLDGAFLFGQSEKREDLMIQIGTDRSRVEDEEKILATLDELVVVEGPVQGFYMSRDKQKYIREIIANVWPHFPTLLIDPEVPRIKRLLFSLHFRSDLGLPSRIGPLVLGPLASVINARVIIPHWEFQQVEFESEMISAKLIEYNHMNFEAELVLDTALSENDVLSHVQNHFESVTPILSLLASNHFQCHSLNEWVSSFSVHGRQF